MTIFQPLFSTRALSKSYSVSSGILRYQTITALDGVSLDVMPGEVLGLVGESGSGKTTFARVVMGLTAPSAGEVVFEGKAFGGISKDVLKARRRRLSIVYQNPFQSLNPFFSVRDIVAEPIEANTTLSASEVTDRVVQGLENAGLRGDHLKRRVRELSGGQAQRVAIARALALEPSLVILDEPTASLDLSVQAQILNLLDDVRKSTGCAYLMITHNLDVVRHLADRIAVMRNGKLVECGDAEQVLDHPTHDYTRGLIAASLATML